MEELEVWKGRLRPYWCPRRLADVAGELADEQELAFSSQGPGGRGVELGDGAGEGFVVCIDDKFPALDEVLKLPYRRSHGEEFAVEC